jgi:transcriptional regulator with XRE-family HTH domain
MKVVSKTSLELHRELLASGLFTRETQAAIADAVHVNQATISRIAKGQFKKVNKSMLAVCKYADIETIKTSGGKHLRALLESRSDLIDPEKRKLIEIIDLAVDLLERR